VGLVQVGPLAHTTFSMWAGLLAIEFYIFHYTFLCIHNGVLGHCLFRYQSHYKRLRLVPYLATFLTLHVPNYERNRIVLILTWFKRVRVDDLSLNVPYSRAYNLQSTCP